MSERFPIDWIVMKALEKDRNRRYETASSFAADVQRYMSDEPVQACPPSAMYRFRKFARRNKVALTTATVVACAVFLAVAGLAASTVVVSRALEREQQDSYRQRIALAEREWSTNNLGRMEQLLDACPADLRGWEWHYLKRLPVGGLPPLHHTASVISVTFSPDDRWIVAGGQDGAVSVWDATTGSKQFTFPAHQRHIGVVAFRPDGRLLATCSWEKKVKVWDFERLRADPANASPLVEIDEPEQVDNVAFSPDGQRLVSCVRDGTVHVWDLVTRQAVFDPLHVLRGNCVRGLAYSPDGSRRQR